MSVPYLNIFISPILNDEYEEELYESDNDIPMLELDDENYISDDDCIIIEYIINY